VYPGIPSKACVHFDSEAVQSIRENIKRTRKLRTNLEAGGDVLFVATVPTFDQVRRLTFESDTWRYTTLLRSSVVRFTTKLREAEQTFLTQCIGRNIR
jgi:hypothetical protein